MREEDLINLLKAVYTRFTPLARHPLLKFSKPADECYRDLATAIVAMLEGDMEFNIKDAIDKSIKAYLEGIHPIGTPVNLQSVAG